MDERITTAGILVIDGRFLIAKREQKGSIGGMWEFVGGKNRWGESEEETLKREYREELDLEIEVDALVHTHDFTNKQTRYHLKAYLVHLDGPFRPRLSVHTEIRWVSLAELEDYAMAPSDAEIVRRLTSSLRLDQHVDG